MTATTPARGDATSRRVLLVVGWAVAFSPVLADLVRHWAAEPWARYSLVFVPLLVWGLARSPAAARATADGWIWLGLAIALEILALAGDAVRTARPALALGAIGLARATGLAATRPLVLLLWVTPLPRVLAGIASPDLERFWVQAVLPLAHAFGATLALEGSSVLAPTATLELRFVDGGLLLAALLSGLGWHSAMLAGARLPSAIARAIGWAALALPLQLIIVALALGLLAGGSPGAARAVLEDTLWVVAAAGILVVSARASRVAAS